MNSGYSRDELIKHSYVASDLLALWEEAGVFQVNERAHYDLRHVVQAIVCDRLYRLGIKAPTLRAACRALDVSWQSGAAVAFSNGQANLWVSFPHSQGDAAGWLARTEPMTRVVNEVDLLSEVRDDGRFGIVMNLTHIVRDVEKRTGERFIP